MADDKIIYYLDKESSKQMVDEAKAKLAPIVHKHEKSDISDFPTFKGSGATTVTQDADGNYTISSTDNNTVYEHPESGVTAGTYKSVTVDKNGHVTSGTNPTTLAGYGIKDAEAKGAASQALSDANDYSDGKLATAKAELQASIDSKSDKDHTHPIDSSLSSTSTNPVQNKIVKAELDKKVSNVSLKSGTTNGTVQLTVNGVSSGDIEITGLNSAAYQEASAFAPQDHGHTVSDISDLNATTDELNILDGVTVKSEEINHLNGVKSNIQGQLDGKADENHTHEIDDALSSSSVNPVQNKVVNSALAGKVPTSRTINGKALTGNISLAATDVGADESGSAELALESANAYTDGEIETVNAAITAHTGKTDIHVTSTEKTSWNGAVTHANSPHAPSGATVVAKSTTNGNIKINGTETVVYTHPSGTNPHGTTKADVGLGKVDNTSDAEKPVSTAQQTAIDTAKASAISTASADATTKANNALASAKSQIEGALTSANKYTDDQVKGLASTSSVTTAISTHDTSNAAHNDIRLLITELSTKVTNFLDVDDEDANELSEILAMIKANEGTLSSLTDSKINVADIVDNLETSVATKVLSANQGVVLKGLIDGLTTAVDGKAPSTHNHTITASAEDDDVVVLTGTNGSNKVTYKASHANSGVTAGTYKSVTVNAKGHVTAGSNPTTLSGYGITDAATSAQLEALAETVNGKSDSGHTHSNATQTVAGFLSIADKKKLDGITDNADKVSFTQKQASGVEIGTITINDTATKLYVPTDTDTGATSVTVTGSGNAVTAASYDPATRKLTLTKGATYNNYSLPAAGSSLGGVKTGGDVSISDGTITVNDDSHNHVISNIDNLQTTLDGKASTSHRHLYYGVCSTAADTAAKTVTIDNFTLETGAMVIVKFTNANSVASPTLNVNSTGAKPICRYGTTAASTGTTTTGWIAGAVQIFVYDGTSWVRDFWENTTYSNVSLGQGYATCTTAAATVAKVGTLSSYSLATGGIVSVKFTYDVPANATLNINSKGAKNIYYRGAKITAGVIKAGDVATFIYSSQYHLIAIDRWQEDVKNSITGLSVSGTTITYTKGNGTTGTITTQDTNTVYTHPTYTARTGKPTANQTPAFGGTATVSQITSDGTGHVTSATDRTITIPSTLSDGTGTAGLIKTSSTVTSASGYTPCPVISGVPYYKDTNTTYTLSTFGITASATELNYCDGVTSNIQTQLNGKAASSHNHAASNITSGTLSSDRLPTVPVAKGGTGATTAAGALTNLGLTATATELNYTDGVTSNIQTQLDDKMKKEYVSSPLTTGMTTLKELLEEYYDALDDLNLIQVSIIQTSGSGETILGSNVPTGYERIWFGQMYKRHEGVDTSAAYCELTNINYKSSNVVEKRYLYRDGSGEWSCIGVHCFSVGASSAGYPSNPVAGQIHFMYEG